MADTASRIKEAVRHTLDELPAEKPVVLRCDRICFTIHEQFSR